MNEDDVREMERLAEDMGELLAELGGAEVMLQLEVEQFRCQLDGDDAGAAKALERVKVLAAHHQAANQMLEAFGLALELRNAPLAHAAHAGVLALVRRVLASEAGADTA